MTGVISGKKIIGDVAPALLTAALDGQSGLAVATINVGSMDHGGCHRRQPINLASSKVVLGDYISRIFEISFHQALMKKQPSRDQAYP